ncbi:hypothetical protein PFISCL1PPCAC_6515, partial [Pristionchus fissidentatus]
NMCRFILAVVFLIVGIVLAAFRFPSSHDAWDLKTIVNNLEDSTPDGIELAHVNIIWRHGDRAPTSPMAGEKAPEEFWTFGGGGWGELSPIGMAQHYDLGKKLFSRYANESQFLSETYKAKEVYVHCTDKNRTVVSAMSNLAGMYSRSKAKVGRDYPDAPSWPTFFVPIPVHTEYAGMDHIGDPATPCPRQDDLWKLVVKTDDYKKANGPDAEKVLQYLRDAIGVDNSAITFENVYKIWDNMLVENIWYADNVSEWYPYYTPEVNTQVTNINNMGIDLVNGIIVDKDIDGYDLTVEIPTIRGGPLVNDIMSKARGVLQCRLRDSYNQQNGCQDKDHFFRNLKYHVISGHDTTIGAYLTLLGAKASILPNGGYPPYSAAILTEFFIDNRNGNTDQVFRVIYHYSPDTDFRVITSFVNGCKDDFCPIEVLQNIANKFAPPGGIEKLCNQRISL